jgi:antagonist of KipI
VARSTLLDTAWTVTEASDRVGVRLGGAPEAIRRLRRGLPDADAASLPMTWGAVQVPPSGEPICLGPDAGTVGGYLVPFVVATVDRGVMGQLRPGDEFRLREIPVAGARAALLERIRWRDAAAAAIASGADWEGVTDASG